MLQYQLNKALLIQLTKTFKIEPGNCNRHRTYQGGIRFRKWTFSIYTQKTHRL